MGSIARVRVFYTDLEEWLTAHREVLIYATSPAGKDINTIEKINEGIIIIGNESKGISEHIFRLADKRISISRKGKAESLNAAVATGIILSHLMG
jgi:TrmH family RNA methyltransferase